MWLLGHKYLEFSEIATENLPFFFQIESNLSCQQAYCSRSPVRQYL